MTTFSKHTHRFPRDKQIAIDSAQIMRHVLYALIPGIVLQLLLYGIGVVVQLLLGCLTAWLCEAFVARIRRRHLTSLDLSSGLLTAALLALSIPSTAPYFVIICAVAFGILLGKQVYGGVGMNIFNPAMVGFCAVYLSFSADMSLFPQGKIAFVDSLTLIFTDASIDGLTGATALASLKANGMLDIQELSAFGMYGYYLQNSIWLVGGMYLWLKNVADWRLSVSFLVFFLLATAVLFPFSDTTVSFGQQLSLGALFFTACFIITDPTTAATGRKGRIIYAALAALIAVIIRQFSNMPDSMAFAVLLANTCVPLIDSYTRPTYYRD